MVAEPRLESFEFMGLRSGPRGQNALNKPHSVLAAHPEDMNVLFPAPEGSRHVSRHPHRRRGSRGQNLCSQGLFRQPTTLFGAARESLLHYKWDPFLAHFGALRLPAPGKP